MLDFISGSLLLFPSSTGSVLYFHVFGALITFLSIPKPVEAWFVFGFVITLWHFKSQVIPVKVQSVRSNTSAIFLYSFPRMHHLFILFFYNPQSSGFHPFTNQANILQALAKLHKTSKRQWRQTLGAQIWYINTWHKLTVIQHHTASWNIKYISDGILMANLIQTSVSGPGVGLGLNTLY